MTHDTTLFPVRRRGLDLTIHDRDLETLPLSLSFSCFRDTMIEDIQNLYPTGTDVLASPHGKINILKFKPLFCLTIMKSLRRKRLESNMLVGTYLLPCRSRGILLFVSSFRATREVANALTIGMFMFSFCLHWVCITDWLTGWINLNRFYAL